MPSGRCPPSGLGICTRLTGCGRYVPASTVARMSSQCCRTNAGNASVDIPSIPGAPWFARTRFHALSRFSRSSTCPMRSAFKPHASPSRQGLAPPSGFLASLADVVMRLSFRSALRRCEASGVPSFTRAFPPPARFLPPTMASADSCALGRPVPRPVAALRRVATQVSPDKSPNCPRTTAAFTLPPDRGASSCCADSPQG